MTNIQQLKNKVLEKTQLVFIITDPNQEDNPIIYANEGFSHLTGYSPEEVIGRNCRFLQGEDTDPEKISEIRKAVAERRSVSVEILNYKKSGEPFWNLLYIDPIYIEEEDKYYFAGIQKDITAVKNAERKMADYNREIEKLSTPLVPVKHGVSVLPLIGTIDQKRVDIIVEKVLPRLVKDDVETLILDLSGFADVDGEGAHGIFQLNDLLQLKGVRLIITGVKPKIAMKAKELGINFNEFISFGSVKQAIAEIDKKDCT